MARAAQPDRPKHRRVHPLTVTTFAVRQATACTQVAIPSGSRDLCVTIESEPARERQAVRVAVLATGGPDRNGPATLSVWSNDLPALIACLVSAAMIAERDGVITPLPAEGRKFLAALGAQLPAEN